jgi:hypothetical protein
MAAVYPVAAGTPSFSGTYTPEVYSGKTLVKFYKTTVFGECTNTDYEGEIKKQGDTVHIRTIPDISISDHAINDEIDYETPEPTKVTLYIDKGKRWAFAIDDIQAMQSDIAYVSKWTDDAGEQLGITIDAAILADIYADAHDDNAGLTAGGDSGSISMGASGTPLLVDKSDILDFIVDCNTVLDEQSVPESQRFVVLPPIFCGMIKKSDLKDASLTGDGTSVMRNGIIGMIDATMIHKSRNINVSSGEHDVIFGHPCATTFASQLVKNETLKNPKSFGDLIRGLQVYGYEVIKPEALGHAVIKKA